LGKELKGTHTKPSRRTTTASDDLNATVESLFRIPDKRAKLSEAELKLI